MGKGSIPSRITASGIMYAGNGWLRKVIVRNAAAVGEVIIYDAIAASGTILLREGLKAAAAATGESQSFDWPGAGVKFETGLYGVCSGGVASIMAYYDI